MSEISELRERINKLESYIANLNHRHYKIPAFSEIVFPDAPLTSTSWDGDAFSTTAKTLIDLFTVFAVPKNVKAVLVKTRINDSGSAAGNPFLILSPTNTAGEGPYIQKCSGFADDYLHHHNGIVPCDSNGDIYYQIAASGAGTMDVYLQIYGYVF